MSETGGFVEGFKAGVGEGLRRKGKVRRAMKSEDVVERIVDRICEVSQFSANHEGWWTLCALVGEPVSAVKGWDWSLEEESDTVVVELWRLIEEDEKGRELMKSRWREMRSNGGNVPTVWGK
jgi:hypothetical protein